jgi:hypothetical protein
MLSSAVLLPVTLSPAASLSAALSTPPSLSPALSSGGSHRTHRRHRTHGTPGNSWAGWGCGTHRSPGNCRAGRGHWTHRRNGRYRRNGRCRSHRAHRRSWPGGSHRCMPPGTTEILNFLLKLIKQHLNILTFLRRGTILYTIYLISVSEKPKKWEKGVSLAWNADRRKEIRETRRGGARE